MRTLKAAALYFAVVFGAGFLLGPIRIAWVVPRLGSRTAELLEAPLMLGVTILGAQGIVRRQAIPACWTAHLTMGGVPLMLLAEFTLVLWLRGLSPRQYLATRYPVSGTVYYLLLLVFASMPLIVCRRPSHPGVRTPRRRQPCRLLAAAGSFILNKFERE